MLVTSVEPLRLFVYNDGLARFATTKYQTPNDSNLNNQCMHLTNYAINKLSDNFIRDNDIGSKRSIKSVFLELEKTRGIDKEAVWERICDALVKTILTVQPQLSRYNIVKP